jgi:hypothetical protein
MEEVVGWRMAMVSERRWKVRTVMEVMEKTKEVSV